MVQHVGAGTLGYDNTEQIFKYGEMVWDPVGLAWVRMTQPGAVGGGSGGPATIANGADVAEGATTDAEATGDGTVIAILKRLRTLIAAVALDATLTGGTARFKITDGANLAGINDSTTAANETTMDRLKTNAALRLLDTAQAAGSQLVAAKGDQTSGLWVNVKNAPTVTANAGTNLNTSALNLEATQALIKAKTDNIPAQGQALAAGSMPVVLTAIQQAALTPPAAITGFALEAGNLAALVAAIGAASVDTAAASTLLNLLTQLGKKIDATTKAVVASAPIKPLAPRSSTTLLHRS